MIEAHVTYLIKVLRPRRNWTHLPCNLRTVYWLVRPLFHGIDTKIIKQRNVDSLELDRPLWSNIISALSRSLHHLPTGAIASPSRSLRHMLCLCMWAVASGPTNSLTSFSSNVHRRTRGLKRTLSARALALRVRGKVTCAELGSGKWWCTISSSFTINVREPPGDSLASLDGILIMKSANTDAAEGGECLLGALHETVDVTDKCNYAHSKGRKYR